MKKYRGTFNSVDDDGKYVIRGEVQKFDFEAKSIKEATEIVYKKALEAYDDFEYDVIPLNTYRVKAKYTTYVYMDVGALDKDEAYEIAEDADGSDFKEEPIDAQGEWEIYDCKEV